MVKMFNWKMNENVCKYGCRSMYGMANRSNLMLWFEQPRAGVVLILQYSTIFFYFGFDEFFLCSYWKKKKKKEENKIFQRSWLFDFTVESKTLIQIHLQCHPQRSLQSNMRFYFFFLASQRITGSIYRKM